MSKTSRVFLSAEDLDLARRCARHATMQADPNASDFIAHLLTMYASDNGIPVRKDIAPALTAEQMGARPADVAFGGAFELGCYIDPDRFDERLGGLAERLVTVADA